MRRFAMLFIVLVVVMAGSATLAEENPTASELQATIAALQTQVAEMQGTPSAHVIAFSGTGKTIIDPFDIADGAYKLTFTCTDDPATYPSVTFRGVGDSSGLEHLSIEKGDPNRAEKIMNVTKDARVAGEIDCTGDWTVTGDLLL